MTRWNLVHRRSSPGSIPEHPEPVQEELCSLNVEVDGGAFLIDWSRWSDGKSMGMKCLTIDNGAMRTVILPERGMGIWKSQILEQRDF